MNYLDVWTIVAALFTFNVAYFSYKAGHREGVSEGVDATLSQLEAQGVITLEEEIPPED